MAYTYPLLTEGQKSILTEKELKILRLKSEGYTWSDIGKYCSTTMGTARANHVRAQKKLQKADLNPDLIVDEKAFDARKFADQCDQKAWVILQSITNESIQAATIQQKANALGTLIEKARLLRGEATSIISHDDRRQIKDLIPAIMKEAERRGLLIEGVKTEYESA